MLTAEHLVARHEKEPFGDVRLMIDGQEFRGPVEKLEYVTAYVRVVSFWAAIAIRLVDGPEMVWKHVRNPIALSIERTRMAEVETDGSVVIRNSHDYVIFLLPRSAGQLKPEHVIGHPAALAS